LNRTVAADASHLYAPRNLEFYPFSLKWAIKEGNLGFLDNVELVFEVIRDGSRPEAEILRAVDLGAAEPEALDCARDNDPPP
jgi:hypothetical protein